MKVFLSLIGLVLTITTITVVELNAGEELIQKTENYTSELLEIQNKRSELYDDLLNGSYTDSQVEELETLINDFQNKYSEVN